MDVSNQLSGASVAKSLNGELECQQAENGISPSQATPSPFLVHDWEPGQSVPSEFKNGDTHIWLARLPATDATLAGLIGSLSPEERVRATQYSAVNARRLFVYGRVALRQILGTWLDISPAAVVFGYKPAGKPFLVSPADKPDLRFNLSHSGEMVAIAVTCGREIGIDLEWHGGLEDWAGLESRIFSDRERAELHALPGPLQRAAFFNGWTRKEAWLKAIGAGLIDDLPAIEVSLAPGKEPALFSLPGGPQTVGQWTIHALPVPPDYAGSLVIQSRFAVCQEILG